jgi:hypothetical protein
MNAEDVMHLSADAIRDRAVKPVEFEIPEPSRCDWNLQDAWDDAAEQVRRQAEAFAMARKEGGPAKLNRLTLEFVRSGAPPGGHGDTADQALGDGRHRRLFSAAANLAEFGCPAPLAHALLAEPGLD